MYPETWRVLDLAVCSDDYQFDCLPRLDSLQVHVPSEGNQGSDTAHPERLRKVAVHFQTPVTERSLHPAKSPSLLIGLSIVRTDQV